MVNAYYNLFTLNSALNISLVNAYYNLFTLNSALNISLVNATLSLWKMAQRRTKYVRGKVTWYVGMPHLTWCEGKGPGT